MKRVFRMVPCSVLATAVLLFWNSFASSGPEPGKTPPAQDRQREEDALRLEEIIIQGNTGDPGIIYLLPRAEPPPLPLTASPAERKDSILCDTRDGGDISVSDEPRANGPDQE